MYADVLSNVKKDTTLQEMGLAVAGVLTTLSGDILLIQYKDNQGKVTEISQKISTVLGGHATINGRMQEITLELIRLDGMTTKEEVYDAVNLGNGHMVSSEIVVSVRMTHGYMQIALLKLPAQAAKKLLKKQTLQVNWSNVGIREVMSLPNASNVGHMGTSRRNVYWRSTDLNAASNAAKKATKRRSVQ